MIFCQLDGSSQNIMPGFMPGKNAQTDQSFVPLNTRQRFMYMEPSAKRVFVNRWYSPVHWLLLGCWNCIVRHCCPLKFYGNDNSNWLLLEDNDPKHKSRLCNSWKEENGIQQMNWPQSPDCNPIENFWAFIKARLRGKTFRNLKKLSTFIRRQNIRKIWVKVCLHVALA